MKKVSELPNQITDPFTTLAPAVNCQIYETALSLADPFDTGTPNTSNPYTSQQGTNGAYSNAIGNFLPCFSSESEFVEHIFSTKMVQLDYDLSASWYTLNYYQGISNPSQYERNSTINGTLRVYPTIMPYTPPANENDFQTLLPHERCCLRYPTTTTSYGHQSYGYGSVSNISSTTPIDFGENIFLRKYTMGRS